MSRVKRPTKLSTSAPTANDDSADGYSVGWMWIRTTNGDTYVCIDATVASADWIQINGGGGGSGIVESIVEGTNITVDATDPANPIVSATSGGGVVESIVAGTGITVDDTDPANPIVAASGGGGDGWDLIDLDYTDFVAVSAGSIADIVMTNYFAAYEDRFEVFVKLSTLFNKPGDGLYRLNIRNSPSDFASGENMLSTNQNIGATGTLGGFYYYAGAGMTTPRSGITATNNLIVRIDSSGGAYDPADLTSGVMTVGIRKKAF